MWINGSSTRGGAYGFKLADLSKLVQVKSADSKTTLLHYLAKFLHSKSATAIDELKAQLNALPEAKDVDFGEKKAELAKLSATVKLAQQYLAQDGAKEGDPMGSLLSDFCESAVEKLSGLQSESAATEEKLKELSKVSRGAGSNLD